MLTLIMRSPTPKEQTFINEFKIDGLSALTKHYKGKVLLLKFLKEIGLITDFNNPTKGKYILKIGADSADIEVMSNGIDKFVIDNLSGALNAIDIPELKTEQETTEGKQKIKKADQSSSII